MTLNFLKRQLIEEENYFFTAVRAKRARDLLKRKKEYKWEEPFKIYPSSITSLYICPKKFIEEDVHKAPNFGLDAVFLMEAGKSFHELYQKAIMEFDKDDFNAFISEMDKEHYQFLDYYVRNMYKTEVKADGLLYKRPRALAPDMEKKLELCWPEIPLTCEETGFSMRADLVISVADCPRILDLKTTSVDPDTWKGGYKDKLPGETHKLQVRLYRYFFNLYEYYDKVIEYTGLGYINLLMKSGSPGSEFEKYTYHGKEVDKDVQHLVECLRDQRLSYIKTKKTKDCLYSKCPIHRGKE